MRKDPHTTFIHRDPPSQAQEPPLKVLSLINPAWLKKPMDFFLKILHREGKGRAGVREIFAVDTTNSDQLRLLVEEIIRWLEERHAEVRACLYLCFVYTCVNVCVCACALHFSMYTWVFIFGGQQCLLLNAS